MPTTGSHQLVGWMGVTLSVPENWDLVQVKGNRFDGYLRFEEEGLLRCEVQWTLVSAGRVVLDEQVDRYLQSLEQLLRKQGKTVTVRRNLHLVSRRQVKRNVRDFQWQAGQVGYGMMWFCEECRKALVAQVIGYDHEPVRQWAQQVFLSLSDHADGDWETWALYGLRFEVPVGWQLGATELTPGKIRLTFRLGDDTLTVARFGPASVLLKGKALEEFAVQALGDEIVKQFVIHYRMERFKGHEGMELVGKDKRGTSPLQVFLRRLRTAAPFPRFFGRLWHCEESNRLYLAAGSLSPEQEQIWERFANSVRCHERNEK
ncbi:MAG: hypothetical protein PVTTEEND_001827 [Candidatus Fervidibacter sp.]